MSKLRRVGRKALAPYRKKDRWVNAILGRADGVVAVPGMQFGVYVREKRNSQPYPVYNFRVPLTRDLKVKVGEDPLMPGIMQVLTVSFYAGMTVPQVISVVNHAVSHFLTGSDPIYIDSSQIVNSLVYIYDGMTIAINSGWLRHRGHFTVAQPGYHDLSAYIPANGAIYLLIRADDTGTISFQEGTLAPSYSDLTVDYIPEVAPGYVALAAARLYSGQIILSQVIESRDVVDLRFAVSGYEKLDDMGEPDDNADLDSDETRHGLLPKLSGQEAEYLDGTGHWSTPAGGGGGGSGGDLYWSVDGALSVMTGVAVPIVVTKPMLISSILAYVGTPGSSGSTVIDVNKNGTSVFPGTHPTVAYNDANKIDEVTALNISLVKNDILTLDIDTIAVGAADLVVVLIGVPQFEAAYRQVTFTITGDLLAGAGRIKIPNKTGQTLVITGVYLNVNTAPTGADIIVDANTDGDTIFGNQANRPRIVAGATSGQSTSMSVTSWYVDEIMTIDLDQIGSAAPGQDLTVSIGIFA